MSQCTDRAEELMGIGMGMPMQPGCLLGMMPLVTVCGP